MSEEVVRTVVFDIHGTLAESFGEMRLILEEMKKNEDWRARLAAMAEMRRHIALASRTLEIALSAEAMVEFQRTVIRALAKAPATVRREVMSLFEARSVES